MAVNQITPYLFFNGEAEQALAFYQQALGAEIERVQRYSEMPESAGSCPARDEERIMHAHLRLGAGHLMVSDAPSDRPVPAQGNIQVTLEFDDPREMAQRFDAVAATGEVAMAIHDAFWGAKFGMLKDRFGVGWLFVCPMGEER
jgi:PhnB protein